MLVVQGTVGDSQDSGLVAFQATMGPGRKRMWPGQWAHLAYQVPEWWLVPVLRTHCLVRTGSRQGPEGPWGGCQEENDHHSIQPHG